MMKESINTTTVGGQFKANGMAGGEEENKKRGREVDAVKRPLRRDDGRVHGDGPPSGRVTFYKQDSAGRHMGGVWRCQE